MIGQFTFAVIPAREDVVLEMIWDRAAAKARVYSPAWVFEALADTGIGLRSNDEYVSLPIGLSYAVLVATMAGAKLTVSGDRSAWPVEWGELCTVRRCREVAKSH